MNTDDLHTYGGRYIIYALVNKINGREYVGISSDVKSRIQQHLWSIKNKKHLSKTLMQDLEMFSVTDFYFIILEDTGIECIPPNRSIKAYQIERDYIKERKPYYNNPNPTGLKKIEVEVFTQDELLSKQA